MSLGATLLTGLIALLVVVLLLIGLRWLLEKVAELIAGLIT